MLIYKFEGKEYEYDQKMTVEDAIFIFEKSGKGVNEIGPQLQIGNPLVIASFVYLLRRRAGEAVRWEDMKKANINTFDLVPDENMRQAVRDRLEGLRKLGLDGNADEIIEQAEKANPTKRGTTRKRAASST